VTPGVGCEEVEKEGDEVADEGGDDADDIEYWGLRGPTTSFGSR
jgi:hypothetical protein